MGAERGGEEEGAQLCQGIGRGGAHPLIEVEASGERCRVEVALVGASISEKKLYMKC